MSDYISREAAVTIADYAADIYPYDKDPKKPETYSDYNQGWNDACDYIRGKLEEEKPADVEPVRHWIPCSERMPEVDDIYLCVYHFPSSNKSRCTTLFFYATDLTPHFQDENYCGIQVTHWLPTPPLPSLGER